MGSYGVSGQLLLMLVFIALMYFVLSQLKNGDRVTTNGGIRGVIISVKEDVVQLRVAPDNVKLEFVKSAIAAVTLPDESKQG